MAKITDPSKLLPSAKVSSSIVRVGRSSIVPSVKFSTKSIALSTEVLRRKRVQETSDVNGQLVRIGNFFKIDLENSKKEAEKKRKEKEKEDFSEAEKKLETPKVKGFKFPKMNFPAMGLLERIKKFLFFTAVGWLLPKLIELIPKLEGVLKLITGTYLFVEDIFNRLLDGFSTLVKFGGDLKNNAIGFLAKTKGGNYQKEFDKLESQFNNFVNLSIVAGLLGTDIGLAAVDEYNKWRKKNQEVARGKFGTGAAYLLKDAGRELGERKAGYQDPGRYRAKGQARAGGFALEQARKKLPPPKPPSWWNRIFKGPLSKLKKPFSRFLGVAIPGAGAAFGAINAKIRFDSGDKLGGTLASISAALDAGTALAALTGIGLPVAGVLGTISMGIDVLLLIRDVLRIFRVPDKILGFSNGGRVVRKYQGGGNTRQSRSPRRSFTPAKRKPFKISPQRSQPGKDVGGKKEIEILYPDTKKKLTVQEWIKGNYAGTYDDYKRHYERNTNQPNSYKALTFASQSFKDLPAGLGHIVGAAIDSTLGQKVDVKRAIQQFSYGMAYLAENYANQRVNMSMSSLARDVNVFADGGYVPPSREMRRTNEMANFGEMLSRVLEPAINLKINEVIQSVRKEINKKGTKKDEGQQPGEGLDVEGGDAVTGGNADFWALAAIAALENGNPQGRADVAQAIYNRVAAGKKGINFGQRANTILNHIIASGQFSPVGESNVSLWAGIVDKQSAIAAIESHPNGRGRGEQLINAAAAAITNSELQRSAAEFVGGRTDFAVPSAANKAPGGFGYVTRHNHLFGWYVGSGAISYGKTNPGPAVVPSLGNVTVMRGAQAGASFVSDDGVRMTVSSAYRSLERPNHIGIDIVSQSGRTAHLPVVIKKSGIVIYAGISGKNMGIVEINHSDGSSTRHLHVNQFRVKTNDSVRPGQVLARLADMGEPGIGNATGPHLHFEWYPKGISNGVANPTSIWRSYVSLGGRVTQISPMPLDSNISPSVLSQQPSRPVENLAVSSVIEAQRRIQNMRVGQRVDFPGIGYVTLKGNKKEYYDNNGRQIEPSELFKRIRDGGRRGQSSRPQQPQIGPRSPSGFSAAPSGATGVQFYTNPEGNKLTYYILRGHDGPKYYAIVNGESWGVGRERYEEVVKLIRKRNRSTNPFSNLMRIITGGKQKGGLIAPSTSRLPIPNSFASYEHPDSRMMIAIQPIIIEKTVPTSSSTNSPITFPVLVGVNNNNLDSYRG
jgi:murein DD-endopeptidase MepM/ murein hydrolase activator NlpD